MIRLDDNIRDDELRVLGKPSEENPKRRGFRWYYAVAILLLITNLKTSGRLSAFQMPSSSERLSLLPPGK